MVTIIETEDNTEVVKSIPEELPILPLRNTVAFPLSALPLVVGIPRSVKLIEDAQKENRLIGLLATKDPSIEEPKPGQIYETGTVAKLYHVVRTPNDTLQVVVQGLERFHVEHWLETEPYLRARIRFAPDLVESDVELDALKRTLHNLAREVIALSPNLPEEVGDFLNQVQDPRYLAYLVAANARLETTKAQQILEIDNVKDKLRALISHLSHEKEVLSLGQKIQTEAQEEIDKAQREYYLRQQLKAIQKELGETDETQSVAAEYTERIEKANLPEEAMKEAQRELKRLSSMSPQSAEHSLIKTYLDWLVELPWNDLSEDQLDVNHARSVLDEDHYDLQEVKDRIIEYLAVRKLVKERGVKNDPGTVSEATASEAMGAILCFVGPPGP